MGRLGGAWFGWEGDIRSRSGLAASEQIATATSMTNSLHHVDWARLPEPKDDGAASHLRGSPMPVVALASTEGIVDLSDLSGRTVLYIYPMTGTPGSPLPTGWNDIPGARGCTPQSCAFRDHFAELRGRGVDHIFGLSTQTLAEQAEAATRLHLPFPLLSDADLKLARALDLPMFKIEGATRLKRLTMVIDNGRITKVFYPVFPPDRSASDVIDWLTVER